MAFPTILIDSATGTSNAAGATASGAGPSTALTGSTGATADNGSAVTARRVNLDGSPDLTNVATDGSHVIYFRDTTAGRRRFARIEGKGNSGTASAYVDVMSALGGGANGVNAAWAIGGKLDTLGNANNVVLIDNNSAAGDAAAGWTVEFASTHTETNAAAFNVRVDGSTGEADGPFTIRGASESSRAVIKISIDGGVFVIRGEGQVYENLDVRCTAASPTVAYGFASGSSGAHMLIRNCLMDHVLERLTYGVVNTSGLLGWNIEQCSISALVNGIHFDATGHVSAITGCRIYDCGGKGVHLNDAAYVLFMNNLVYGNTGDGLYYETGGGSARAPYIVGNTFYDNGGDGLEFNSDMDGISSAVVMNNIFKSNAGYGWRLPAGFTDLKFKGRCMRSLNNVFHGNTSGASSISLTYAVGTLTVDPAFADAANGDFTPTNIALAGAAYPLTI